MPVIEYRCQKCGLIEEVIFRDGKPTRKIQCACGSKDLKKIPSSFNWKFGEAIRTKK